MATILPYRPPTSGTSHSSSTGLDRKASLSSFPSSRTPSSTSLRNSSSHKVITGRSRRNDSDSSTRTPPTPSSHSNPINAATSRSPRKVKPQYPADSFERHVEYILVASFDIDRGPTMEHQYPGAISGDENMLAELMLPDQAHVRNQDWTIFFLHKDTGDEEEAADAKRLRQERKERRKKRKEDAARGVVEDGMLEEVSENEEEQEDEEDEEEEDEIEGGEGLPLIYVLNLVNTKQDNTAKRCQTKHPQYLEF